MPKVWNKRDPNTPKDAVYVGRPTKWGNPYKMEDNFNDREAVVNMYRELLECNDELAEAAKLELKGKDLVCYCAPKSCHANILLETANSE